MLLSEMFGVERDTEFSVEGYYGKFRVRVDTGEEYLVVSDGKGSYDTVVNGAIVYGIINAAPDNIIHLPPPLTDEQREQLKAIWTLGGRWLAKDCDGVVNYYIQMPHKESGYWYDPVKDEKYGYAIPLSACVCELHELNKADEPLDIGKALGVEG